MTDKQLIFGMHSVEALLQRQPDRASRIVVQAERQDKKITAIISLAKASGIAVDQMPRAELDRLTSDANHQGVIAYCRKQHSFSESDLYAYLEKINEPPFLLILDGVQDPHNLGACFRSADAAGVHAIIAPKDKAVGITPVVSKVACGAAEAVPFVQVTNLARTIAALKEKGIWVYGAAGDAPQSVYQTDLRGACAIVLGAEGSGMRRLTRDHCDALINIPMHGTVSSLNVSVATGVILFEVKRQRL